MTRDQHVRYIPNLDPSRKKINVIARLEAFVNNPNIKAISIITYERGFVVLYQEARSNLRKRSLHEDKDSKKASPWTHMFFICGSHPPVMRVSTDNGATFGPMLVLATNGTIDEAAEEEQEEKSEK
jgi:hypothetical protein